MSYSTGSPYNFDSPYAMAKYYNVPTVDPESQRFADCPFGTYRTNNYFKKCAGLVFLCRDACFDPVKNHYEGIGPWKSCGICVGGYTDSPFNTTSPSIPANR